MYHPNTSITIQDLGVSSSTRPDTAMHPRGGSGRIGFQDWAYFFMKTCQGLRLTADRTLSSPQNFWLGACGFSLPAGTFPGALGGLPAGAGGAFKAMEPGSPASSGRFVACCLIRSRAFCIWGLGDVGSGDGEPGVLGWVPVPPVSSPKYRDISTVFCFTTAAPSVQKDSAMGLGHSTRSNVLAVTDSMGRDVHSIASSVNNKLGQG